MGFSPQPSPIPIDNSPNHLARNNPYDFSGSNDDVALSPVGPNMGYGGNSPLPNPGGYSPAYNPNVSAAGYSPIASNNFQNMQGAYSPAYSPIHGGGGSMASPGGFPG